MTRPDLTDAKREAVAAAVPVFSRIIKAAESEVDALLRATDPDNEDNDLATLREHLESNPPSALAVAFLIQRVQKLERTAGASHAASSKNKELIEWARGQWADSTDRDQGRASFARTLKKLHAAKLAGVTDKRIAEHWLKGR